jgi:hypothetical protein
MLNRKRNLVFAAASLAIAATVVCGCQQESAPQVPSLAAATSPDVAPSPSPAATDKVLADPVDPVLAEPGPIRFRDVTSQSGIEFQHTDGSFGKRYIVETVASGLVSLDYDGDGLTDIHFCNGASLADTPGAHRDHLYRNLGDFRFTDVTDKAGVGDLRYSLGAVAGDFNEDGFPDLYISNYGANALYRNNGDGTFTSIEEESGTAAADPKKVGAGAAFFDMDADGDLDLFVANYMSFSVDQHIEHQWKGVTIYSGPLKYPFYVSLVFRNNGDGTFTDASAESGVQSSLGHGMGIVCSDVDRDGDTDVFVNNDGAPGNFLFRNDGQGRFEEVAALSGTAFSADGLALGSMGVDCGDYDNDGLLDFYVTAYQEQLSHLFRNRGDGLFEDVTRQTGAGADSYNRVTWGCSLTDFDNDAWRDIFLACGHLIDNVDQVDDTTAYAQLPIVLRNLEGNGFANVSASSGEAFQKPNVGRGAAFDDFNGDGRVDVVILNARRSATLLANESPPDRNWLVLQLVGRTSSRDAAGARIQVTAGGIRQTSEVHRGRGYQGHFGSRLHFGVGAHDRVDRIEVHWMAGGVDTFNDVPVNQVIAIREGGGLTTIQAPAVGSGATSPGS